MRSCTQFLWVCFLAFNLCAEEGKGARHWAFQPITKPDLPRVKNKAWVRNSIDRFILARLESKRIDPSPIAPEHTLVRRLSLDLTGLPPEPKAVKAFKGDKAPDAYSKYVKRLMASPHYGERMAQNWFDLARFADTSGYAADRTRNIWPYRDWVIDAFNRNVPFGQFTIDEAKASAFCTVGSTPNAVVTEIPHLPDAVAQPGFLVAVVGKRHRALRKPGHRMTDPDSEESVSFWSHQPPTIVDSLCVEESGFLALHIGEAAESIELRGVG